MKLYFLRHGEALDRSIWKGEDSLRKLTADGEKEIELEARALASLIPPSTILASPYARAAKTAELFSAVLGFPGKPILDERLQPGFDLVRLKEIIAEHKEDESLLLVGHEPDFSRIIAGLIGGGAISLKKGALARVDWDPRDGKGSLEWLVPPRLLIRKTSGA
jgi:phosphohistidine phosphatase